VSSVLGAPVAGWREPPTPRSVLTAAGIASASATASARLCDVSRSHTVIRACLPDGRAFIIKALPRDTHASGRSLVAELYVYRLASWRPDVAALLPTCVHLDERRQVLVLHAAPPEQLFAAHVVDEHFPGRALAAALGRGLALLHTATADVPAVTVANCGVLGLPDAPPATRRLGDNSEAGQAAIARMCADDHIATRLRATAQLLKPTCLIHGDVKWDNVIMDAGPPARVTLFDWELSGWGDPAWDVGSALADAWCLTARDAMFSGDPRSWLRGSERALLAAYGAGRGDLDVGFADRVAGCWCARTAHLALECAAGVEDARHPKVGHLLSAAGMLAHHCEEVADAVAIALGGG
jgi:hypothetical protein